MRVLIRAFAQGVKLFEEEMDADEVEAAAERHVPILMKHPLHMVEIEFLDEPDQEHRFIRFGTDMSQMVIPIQLRKVTERWKN